ncbi:MAG: hypothetical protein HY259_06090 [Chloroflexi bacterium]|nr:hypothetical protein [Chloroflexota bacterium]
MKKVSGSDAAPLTDLRWMLVVTVGLALVAVSLFSPAPQPVVGAGHETAATPTATPVPVPSLLSPGNGITATVTNYAPLALPDFSWTPISGTTYYRVQFSQDIGFSSPSIRLNIATPNTQFTPLSADVFSDGTWYWRVQVDSPYASGYQTTPGSFTKQWASVGNLPALTAPDDGATVEFYDQPIFSWLPVMGAADYRFQISPNTGFTTLSYDLPTLATTHQPQSKLANGTYYWRVIPRDPFSREGTPSVVRSFTVLYGQVPALLEPANNATPTFTPSFRWTAVRGAQYYRLQYGTDPTFSPNSYTQIDSKNTSYTPLSTLPNDVNYYWRVEAISSSSVSAFSAAWTFRKQWYLQPDLLTPVNNYQYVSEPFFSWTPVAGAHSYQIEVSTQNSFPPIGGLTDTTINPYYVKPNFPWESNSPTNIYYWRVTPVDTNGNLGKASNVVSFVSPITPPLAVRQIYPYYYYTPTATLQPHEDRTAPLPVFMWHRIITPTLYSVSTLSNTAQITAYRAQVSPSPLFLSGNWTFDTENLNAAPNASNPFTPTVGGVYYWRVMPLDAVGGNPIGQWSQVWKTRIDTTLALSATTGLTPTLLRPAQGSEWVETTPLLEWWPLQGADAYDVQVSSDANFGASYIVMSSTVTYPVFAPPTRLGYGTYYWRVRALSGGVALGNYSAGWRFQVAAQSRWRENRPLGDSHNQVLIGSNTSGIMTDTNYVLTTLYAAQSKDFWYFGFNATGSADVTYGLYLDLDHVDGSGGNGDALGLNILPITAHQPEYAIYVLRQGGVLTASTIYIFPWNGSAWGTPQALDAIGGALYYSATANYVEVKVPNTAIGMQQTTNSAAIVLFSAMSAGGHAQATVPFDPNVTYSAPDSGPAVTTLSRFSSVSERLNVTLPPSNITGDPVQFSSVPPFVWQLPVDVPAYYGIDHQVHKDPQFTSLVAETPVCCSSLIPPDLTTNASPGDLQGDNTYYWRVRPAYNATGVPYGSWSQSTAFNRQGLVPTSLTTTVSFALTTSVTLATPTFVWDMAEGAETYNIQVAVDPGFASPVIDDNTARNAYTPSGTLGNASYYWRVRIKRLGGVTNNWTAPRLFTQTLPLAANLNTLPAGVVGRSPTFCWDPLITTTNSIAVLAAWRYRLQISRGDPTFSSILESDDTEQSCWTPTIGYDDGTFYYRVAMMDGNGTLGSYSAAAQVTKQYPVTTLISPTNGSGVPATPTFVWTPVNGANNYSIQVSQFPSFSPLYDDQITNNARYTPLFTYVTDKNYYWRVAIIDKNGKYGPYNNATIILSPYPYKLYLPGLLR